MLSRRVVLGAGLGVAALAAERAVASDYCRPDYRFGQSCTASVDLPSLYAAYEPQYQSQWCWAACISMVFDFYGHPLAQDTIVQTAYGGPVNLPAQNLTMSQALNRDWVDDNGASFSARLVAAYDPTAGVVAINDQTIAMSLATDHPLIIGAAGHAVVLTSIDYVPSPAGPQILGAGVFDPWPGRGARTLSLAELVPVHRGGALAYIAAINVF